MHQFLKYFLVHQLPIKLRRNLAYRKMRNSLLRNYKLQIFCLSQRRKTSIVYEHKKINW